MTHFFIALFTFLVVPNVLSRLFRIRKVLPLVFLQLMFGLALSASGIVGQLQAQRIDLLHGPLASALEGLGWLGVALLVAITGAEVQPEPAEGARARWQVAAISVLGFAGTWAIGALVAYGLVRAYPELMGTLAQPLLFAAGSGLALAVTALPVLAVIVRQGEFGQHPIAKLAMQCALLDDLWLWLGMTAILAWAASAAASPLRLALGLACYLALMLWLVRPALRAWYARHEGSELDGLMLAVGTILMSAALTGLIGLHSIFGAFVAGAILPREALLRWREPMQQLIHVLLLPAFFILTGMRLRLDLHSPLFWELTAIVSLTAVLGKMLTVALSARLTGMAWKDGLALGSLMQCKGLMELIAINILLDAGIIGKQLFSALAMMAMLSTFVTLPMTRQLLKAAAAGVRPRRRPAPGRALAVPGIE